MYGEDYQYANSRLSSTVVRHGKKPVYIDIVNDDGVCMCRDMREEKDELMAIPLSELNLQPVPLGYVNKANRAGFMIRKPMRQDWRQGLRNNNCIILSGQGLTYANVYGKALYNTITGQYPSFKQCVKKINGEVKSIAWCRDFCMNDHREVWYKGLFKVGKLNNNSEVVLNGDYKYLQEKLETTL